MFICLLIISYICTVIAKLWSVFNFHAIDTLNGSMVEGRQIEVHWLNKPTTAMSGF